MFLFLPLKRCCSKLDNAATHGQVIEMYSIAMDVGESLECDQVQFVYTLPGVQEMYTNNLKDGKVNGK